MITLQLVPHDGLGPLKLGAARQALRAAATSAGLAAGETHAESDSFAEDTVQVDYDEAGRVRFIGIAPLPAVHRAVLLGLDCADTPAADLFRALAAAEGGSAAAFDPDGHLFPRQIVALWAADEQYDLLAPGGRRRPIWGQVGIGTPAYRDLVEKTRARDT
ncbi:hypothetical protein [Phreatobacter cathodiphilus]|uniref:Uncharacterized protein n=1 Tax=Phreatobacter cathodiphilus TaxID=1868589 RepID=A0A2S0N8Y6_9HYPH|nr:hypothetical protein [Phreatobacter cathodiphilus]AVO44393.1 hypothetical protein C6569_04565 [Phreatobacter cathodiphilus]